MRRRSVDVHRLSAEQRATLSAQLYEVYCDSVAGLDRQAFDAEVLASDDTRLALFYAANGTLAGFAYRRFDHVEHAGRRHAVICAGVYFRRGHKGGAAGGRFGLGESLRFKLRHPRTPLAYMTRSASPAVYRLLAGTMPRIYPHPHVATPPDVDATFRAVHARRGYQPVADSPWVVRSIAVPTQPGRLNHLRGDPLVEYYLGENPHFAQGNALLVWIPLDLRNVVGAALRLGWRRLRGH
ncbi:MAG: hypothetical protein HY902_00235 [Deltaproteobacteria bacterium]|nr:hypothetical protein [Deltaproteobacteria bacterium]